MSTPSAVTRYGAIEMIHYKFLVRSYQEYCLKSAGQMFTICNLILRK
jgi:hypothetical protein